ncbi:MAG: UDP-N-acetylmuramoyl-tripeptide--D-alanyl-D-alanine ligase, partial [Nitrospirota bacterium]|nr:UDP-N-acetylmuramoyl-tripeptide--D-alanyl-D-alanine ligase [Nitrospirota bacterium]
MATFEVDEVLVATQGTLLSTGLSRGKFRGVQTDSRAVKPGDLFVALKGPNFDGHEFIESARKKGATGVVIEEAGVGNALKGLRQQQRNSLAVVHVKNTLRAYQDLASFHRARFSIPVVAITGSNGKTTTKEMVSRVLATRWRVLQTEKNFNNAIGVPKTLLRLNARHQAAVIEMGVDQVGQTTRLCEMTQPTVGVVTNVGPDHLEFYRTMARSAVSKAELFPWLPKDGAAILNADDRYFRQFLTKAQCRIVSFGLAQPADVRGTKPVWDGRRTAFQLWMPNRKTSQQASVRTMGLHNISNALAGAAVGHALGFSTPDIVAGLGAFRPAPMRSEIRRHGGVIYLYDCYNANPASVKAALDVLVELDPQRRTIAVLGDMLELGPKEGQFHQEIGRYAAQKQV